MFSFLKSGSEDNELSAVVVLGSGLVVGGLVHYGNDKQPEILFSSKAYFRYHPDNEEGHYERSMLTAFLDVALELQMHGLEVARSAVPGGRAPIRATVVLAAPWYSSLSKVIHYQQQKSFEVSEELVEQLVDEALEAFRSNDEEGEELLERHIIETKVNGYATTAPFGKRGRDLSLALYASVSASHITEQIEDILDQVFHPEVDISFHALDLVAFSVFRDTLPNTADFLLVDVSAEITEVGVVRDGILAGSVTFPVGVRSLARLCARTHDTPIEELESCLGLAIAGSATKPDQAALQNIRDAWIKEMLESLKELDDASIPAKAFVMAARPFAQWFANSLADHQFSKLTFGSEPIDAETGLEALLKKHCRLGPRAGAEPFLMLGSIFGAKQLASTFGSSDAILGTE